MSDSIHIKSEMINVALDRFRERSNKSVVESILCARSNPTPVASEINKDERPISAKKGIANNSLHFVEPWSCIRTNNFDIDRSNGSFKIQTSSSHKTPTKDYFASSDHTSIPRGSYSTMLFSTGSEASHQSSNPCYEKKHSILDKQMSSHRSLDYDFNDSTSTGCTFACDENFENDGTAMSNETKLEAVLIDFADFRLNSSTRLTEESSLGPKRNCSTVTSSKGGSRESAESFQTTEGNSRPCERNESRTLEKASQHSGYSYGRQRKLKGLGTTFVNDEKGSNIVHADGSKRYHAEALRTSLDRSDEANDALEWYISSRSGRFPPNPLGSSRRFDDLPVHLSSSHSCLSCERTRSKVVARCSPHR
jgi:hypothetical protein